MEHEALATYLEDHLAGAATAIDLIRNVEEDHAGQPLGRVLGFQALEFLAIGVWGKRALWRALRATEGLDARLGASAADFDRLIRRAEEQHERIEALRLTAAAEAFARDAAPAAARHAF
jgi:hypothetical protein